MRIRAAWTLALGAVGIGWTLQVPLTLTERYDFEAHSDRARLPNRLDEVSGLAVTGDGRVFTHTDERAVIYEIDPSDGGVIKRFGLGVPALSGDFEGIAIAGERFFLVSSQGFLLEFREGAAEQVVAFRGVDTGLLSRCEVEGLAHDPSTGTLLAACKTVPGRDRGAIVVYRIDAATLGLRPDRITVPLSELERVGLRGSFAPSGIEVDPATGTLILVSARDEAIVEIRPDGTVLSGFRFGASRHPQAEGVTFLPDGSLLLADESQGGRARLTRYGPRPLPGPEDRLRSTTPGSALSSTP